MIKEKKGLALIAAIMLIVFISIAVLGLSVFIVGWYKQIDTDQRKVRCIYNAMAGVNYSLYQYRNSAALTNGTINIDANNNFTLSTVLGGGGSGAASGFIIDGTGSSLGSNNRQVNGVILTNSSGSAIIINRIIVTWTGSSSTLTTIRIGNVNVWSGSDSSSPGNCNITNTTIPAGSSLPLTRVRWDSSMLGRTITLQFVMTDGSITPECTVYPTPGATCASVGGNLTIKSMGKTMGSNQYRSVQAAYDTSIGNVSDYDEISQTVP